GREGRGGCGRAPAAMNLHRFGPSARIPTPLRDPFLTGVPRPTAPRSTTRAVARVEQGRSSQAVADHFTIRGRSLKHSVTIEGRASEDDDGFARKNPQGKGSGSM